MLTDQAPRSAAFELDLHRLRMPPKRVSGVKSVKYHLPYLPFRTLSDWLKQTDLSACFALNINTTSEAD